MQTKKEITARSTDEIFILSDSPENENFCPGLNFVLIIFDADTGSTVENGIEGDGDSLIEAIIYIFEHQYPDGCTNNRKKAEKFVLKEHELYYRLSKEKPVMLLSSA